MAVCPVKQASVDAKRLAKQERDLKAWEARLASRRERLLDALESGQVDPAILNERLARIEEERGRFQQQRAVLEHAKIQAEAAPTVERFRTYGQELRKPVESGPVAAAKLILRRFVRTVTVAPGALNVELVIRRPRQFSGSGDEFAPSQGWWS